MLEESIVYLMGRNSRNLRTLASIWSTKNLNHNAYQSTILNNFISTK